jgi:hypothetical protein
VGVEPSAAAPTAAPRGSSSVNTDPSRRAPPLGRSLRKPVLAA